MRTEPAQPSAAWLTLPWDGVVAHYDEIALKRGNRSGFVQKLHQNLRRALKPLDVQITTLRDRLMITGATGNLAELLDHCRRIFGVSYVAPVRILPVDLPTMTAAALECYRAVAVNGDSFAIRCKRTDKSFPQDSPEIMRRIGAAVVAATGAPVNLTDPRIEIRFRVYDQQVYLIGPRHDGPGGLPIGVTGKVLMLLSGGLDSPVAAWRMLRRGCAMDFVHFHVFPDGGSLRDTKIPRLVAALLGPHRERGRLFLVPYHPFQLQLIQTPVPPALELVVFRRFMIRVSGNLADRHNCLALVTGDNLAQVASQTLRNLAALEDATDLPVLRPLLAENKTDIVKHSRALGFYDTCIEEYKDCCSLVSRHPSTKASRDQVERAEFGLPVSAMTEKALADACVWTFDGGQFLGGPAPLPPCGES